MALAWGAFVMLIGLFRVWWFCAKTKPIPPGDRAWYVGPVGERYCMGPAG
jgi:hypothetical protein